MSGQLTLWPSPDEGGPDPAEGSGHSRSGVQSLRNGGARKPRRKADASARDVRTSQGRSKPRSKPRRKPDRRGELQKLWLPGPAGRRQLSVDSERRIVERTEGKIIVVADCACYQRYGDPGQRQMRKGVYVAGDRINWGKLRPKPKLVWHNPWWEEPWSEEGEFVPKSVYDDLWVEAKLKAPPALPGHQFFWQDPELVERPVRRGRPHPPNFQGRDRGLFIHLWEARCEISWRICALFWSDLHPSVCWRRLEKLWKAGYLERGRGVALSGSAAYVYALRELGYKCIEGARDGEGRMLVPKGSWQERFRSQHSGHIEHDLRASGATCELNRLFEKPGATPAEGQVGPDGCRLRRKGRSAWVEVRPAEPEYGAPRYLDEEGTSYRIAPDGALCGWEEREDNFEILIELDRTGRADYNEEKLERYRELIDSGWSRTSRELPEPPLVLFVCPGERALGALMVRANELVAYPSKFVQRAPHPARARILFCLEAELYGADTLAVYALPHEICERKGLGVRIASLPEGFRTVPWNESHGRGVGPERKGLRSEIAFAAGLHSLPERHNYRD